MPALHDSSTLLSPSFLPKQKRCSLFLLVCTTPASSKGSTKTGLSEHRHSCFVLANRSTSFSAQIDRSMMEPRTRRRRRATPSNPPLLTRALGAACLAGAARLSAAFSAPGFAGINSNAKFAAAAAAAVDAAASSAAPLRRHHGNDVDSSGLGSGSPYGPSRARRCQFAMVSAAVAEPPAASFVGSTPEGGRRERGARRKPTLTVEEERALLAKIKAARVVRECQERLELAAVAAATSKGHGVAGAVDEAVDGGAAGTMVPVEAWAREAGVEVDDLPRVLQDGIEAKRTLVERNMPMVNSMVHGQYRWRLRGGQVSTTDLLQEGAYALGVAADAFDPAMQNRFITYALYTVRDKLDVALARGNSAISVPSSALKELHRARRELTDSLGRKPSEAEMANYFANGVVVVDRLPASGATAFAAEGANERDGEEQAGRGEAVAKREFSIGAPADDKQARQQARTRRRRLNLLSAVQKVTSIDRLIRASDGSAMVPLVDTLAAEEEQQSPRAGGGAGKTDISELLPRVLTPVQADLVRMACGLADGRPMTMAECSKELSLSVARTKSLFDSSLEKLKIAASAENPGRLARQN